MVGWNTGQGSDVTLTDILGESLVDGVLDGNGIQLHQVRIVAEAGPLDKAISGAMSDTRVDSDQWKSGQDGRIADDPGYRR